MLNIKTGTSIAATAALIAMATAATTAPVFAAGASAKLVHCYGINSCKGTSDCKSYGHECKGQNECKGQGFVAKTAKACTKAGGKLTEA